MGKFFKPLLAYVISISIASSSLAAFGAPAADRAEEIPSSSDLLAMYFGRLDQEMPWVTEFALGDSLSETTPCRIADGSPLLDHDAFFLQSQEWAAADEACADGTCFKKESGDLLLGADGATLKLHQKLTPIFEDDDYILLSADEERLFSNRQANAGEGVFFINKLDLKKGKYVPIFFFPLPGSGWTGANDHAFALTEQDQIIVYNHNDGQGLPLDRDDFAHLEKIERDNLAIGKAWGLLDGQTDDLPEAGTTAVFGLMLSGHLPHVGTQASLTKDFGAYAANLVLPQARAKADDPTTLQKLRAYIFGRAQELTPEKVKPEAEKKSWLKRWAPPAILYGGTFALAAAAAPNIDWHSLITADMPSRIEHLAMVMGGIGVLSLIRRYTVDKKRLDAKYPITPEDGVLQKVNKWHKAFLDELTHGLYFSVAVVPQGIRHSLEFLKDRVFPGTHMIHKAWEETMGFQLRQNSKLAMNWKTFYLGSLVFGMADVVSVGLDLMIFTPWLISHFGHSAPAVAGSVTAAYASSELLRNLLSYIQSGAHSYSADVKAIHQKAAENEARRQLEAVGLDPEAARNESMYNRLVSREMAKIFKIVDLPAEEEFLYDPNSVLETMIKKSGYHYEGRTDLSDAQKEKLSKIDFVLNRRRFGMVKPALKKAIATAQEIQNKTGSELGAKTIETLTWAFSNRALTPAIAERAWDIAGSQAGQDGLTDAIKKQMAADSSNATVASMVKSGIKGAYNYLSEDATQEARDIRLVLFLMSTTSSAKDVIEFFPQSWIEKSGSKEAALLAAELFHRSFFAYYEHKPEKIDASEALLAQYGPRAEKVLARIAVEDPTVNDTFAHEVRTRELAFRLKEKTEARLEVLNYKVKEFSAFGKQQWQAARDRAEASLADTDEAVGDEWLGMAEKFSSKTGVDINPEIWARRYRYRMTMAREFTKSVGLEVQRPEDSDFVKAVLIDAAVESEKRLSLQREQFYMQSLPPAEREFYEAQVFTNALTSAYVDKSVRSDEYIKADSPEFPGSFQKFRRVRAKSFGAKMARGVLRFFESAFSNDETAYAPGRISQLERNIPIIPDLMRAFVRNLRAMPYMLSFTYLTSYFLWQIHIPYSIWVIFMATGFINSWLVQFNNRMMRNFDIKPMADIPSKLTYSWFHSRLTNPTIMLIQGNAERISNGVNHLGQEIEKGCARIIGG